VRVTLNPESYRTRHQGYKRFRDRIRKNNLSAFGRIADSGPIINENDVFTFGMLDSEMVFENHYRTIDNI